MAKELDVYRDWLGVTTEDRPPNYYQLLRLKQFEDDIAKIRTHYQKMNAHVRKFSTGDYAAQSQELLNELARAMLCLTDMQRKREYDASLGRTADEEGPRRSFEEVLLANKIIDREQLARARSFADAVGLEVRDAVLQQKMAPAGQVMVAYAESIGLPYIELADLEIDESAAKQFPPTIARQYSCIPVMEDDGTLLVASTNYLVPDVEEELRLRYDMPVRTVLCTASSIHAAVNKYYPRGAAGPEPLAPGKKSSGAQAAPKKTKKQPKDEGDEEPSRPLTREEQIRRRGMFGVIGFNITVMLLVVAFAILRGGIGFLGFGDYVIAVVGALVVGTIAAGVSALLKL